MIGSNSSPGRQSQTRRAAAGVLAASAVVLTLSAPTAAARSTAATSTDGPAYVALGDSYASGAGLAGVKDKECDRTTGSYPSLISKFASTVGLKHTFDDVTCSGATTNNYWNPQGSTARQADALTPRTRLVTLTMGGNDVGFSSVLATCARVAATDRDGTPCKQYFTADGKDVLADRVATMEGRVHDVLADIRRRSPHAKVIVVGYPALFPDNGVGCAEVPFAKGDFAYLRDTTKQADAALRRQATAEGIHASYADTYTPTVGHDMCRPREERWVESLTPAADTAAAHPNESGQFAMAIATLRQIFKP
ncbi:SGNH/GDSL hydrolase family protein [Streptomyces sp. NPDC051665]|uniref:SGNH/GDSL hydrolase family protein n=1 Tax=Streptomyces sp. NPDC051665 TaxID=3154647 RepID=UPI0034390D48